MIIAGSESRAYGLNRRTGHEENRCKAAKDVFKARLKNADDINKE